MVRSDSVLLLTLDSCRYDTFVSAAAPHMKSVGPVHRALAPSHFTFGSHAAMFVGFTPSAPGAKTRFLDNKYSKLFKLRGGGSSASPPEFDLSGPNIIQGFKRRGYAAIGSGAVGWFEPATETGRTLTADFDHFLYEGIAVRRQVAWMRERIAGAPGTAVFCFLNVGETHVPYWHEGAPWNGDDNPCEPYRSNNRADACRTRQRLCCEFVDALVAPLLADFRAATVVICADHGDCWGEDGLWEHGLSHPMTLTVPLVVRVRGVPIA